MILVKNIVRNDVIIRSFRTCFTCHINCTNTLILLSLHFIQVTKNIKLYSETLSQNLSYSGYINTAVLFYFLLIKWTTTCKLHTENSESSSNMALERALHSILEFLQFFILSYFIYQQEF